jgi:hypothetical protein
MEHNMGAHKNMRDFIEGEMKKQIKARREAKS